MLLNVNVTPSSEFERKGQNVYSTIRVPFTTAALGGKARVHTLYGDVECSIKAGTQGGSKIRLKGKGISKFYVLYMENKFGIRYTIGIIVQRIFCGKIRKDTT